MFFIIKSSNPRLDLKIQRTKRHARKALLLYPYGVTEKLIDNYLKETYNISLILACRRIIQNLTFTLNMQDEIIAKIPDLKLNEIARTINYGTGRIPGSRILRQILEIT